MLSGCVSIQPLFRGFFIMEDVVEHIQIHPNVALLALKHRSLGIFSDPEHFLVRRAFVAMSSSFSQIGISLGAFSGIVFIAHTVLFFFFLLICSSAYSGFPSLVCIQSCWVAIYSKMAGNTNLSIDHWAGFHSVSSLRIRLAPWLNIQNLW